MSNKRFFTLCMILGTVFCKSHAQFDFILNGLGNLSEVIGGTGDGYLSTMQDLEAAQRALELINDSKCLLEDLEFNMELYEEEIGYSCFENIEIDLYRAKLDNSSIVIADQLYANAENIFSIFDGLLGGEGDRNLNSSVNKGVVTDAIEDAIQALIELLQKKEQIEMEILQREEMNNQVLQNEVLFTSIVQVGDYEYADRLAEEGEREMAGASNLVELASNVLTTLIFIFAGWTVFRDEQVKPMTLVGLITAMITIGVANFFI